MPDTRTDELVRYINLKLAALGQPTSDYTADPAFLDIAGPLLRNFYQKDQLLGDRLCPTDARIQAFLDAYLSEVCPDGAPRLPSNTFVLDRKGLAREMSLPPDAESFSSPYLQSYRIPQGVLHNPKSDRRTTQGIFHIVEGGLPVPADKIAVPKQAFAALLRNGTKRAPEDVLTLPFTANQEKKVRLFVSLLLRPLVCPAAAWRSRKDHGDPLLRAREPGQHPGFRRGNFLEWRRSLSSRKRRRARCAALERPQRMRNPGSASGGRKEEGSPGCRTTIVPRNASGATASAGAIPDEAYNDGKGAFKIACRDRRGVMVTIIADNYYGYCKKEVKTQISYAANLFGNCEEEHAGGAIAFPAYVLGQEFYAGRTVLTKNVTFENAMSHLGSRVEIKPERYAVDKLYPDVFYVPENSDFSVRDGWVKWPLVGKPSGSHSLSLQESHVYVLPWGTRIRLRKQTGGTMWRLIATRADGTLCHKPCTVSGGGKSEISKSIGSIVLKGPVIVSDYHRDMDTVEEILLRDFSAIYKTPHLGERAKRPILSPQRSLGSVIKLMTPSAEYTAEHNQWLRTLPQTVRQLLITVKRYYRQDWGDRWREHFTVDRLNGSLGHELKYRDQKLVGNYLRVGWDPDGSWRIFKLRPDFSPADKVQVEDDITASVVLPRERLNNLDPEYLNPSLKLVQNCETLLFQRPDDAIHRGFDVQAEADMAAPGNFISNFEPLTREQARNIVDHVSEFDRYTDPMKKLLTDFVKQDGPGFIVSSAHPRMVDGSPSKNPRYLQRRPDLVNPRETHLAEMGARMNREIPSDKPVYFPVNAVLPGRRNNPPDLKTGVPPLAVYNPIHYQELPELFMDFICSLTGKSPSTTGFGSEGALTKGPFNALLPVVDVNAALVSAIVTGYGAFSTSAGYIGPKYRVDHDNSMLIPELWCRMRVSEREPKFLIDNGYLEKVEDRDFGGRKVQSSRLGYRITSLFVDRFLGRIFEMPGAVFPEDLLKPELQDEAAFVQGVDAIVESQRCVALNYFEDSSIEVACPPIRALLHIMAHGHWEGKGIDHPEVRAMFTREATLASDWYRERLHMKQRKDIALWQRRVAAIEAFRREGLPAININLAKRLSIARDQMARASSPAYLEELNGTIGVDPTV